MGSIRAIAVSFFAAAVLLCPGQAFAAQEATVGAEQAAIRERPTLDSKIIESKPTGAIVRVSSFSKDGWYKTKSSIGQYGWIWQGDLTLSESTSDMKAASLELKDSDHVHRAGARIPWFHVRLGATFFPLLATDLADTLGLIRQHLWLTYGGWGEFQINLNEGMRIGARIQTWSNSSTVSNLGVNYAVSMSATPVFLGIEQDVSRGETFALAVAMYAGLSFGNSLTVANTSSATQPNSATISDSNEPDFMINVVARYEIYSWLELVGDAGFFYTFVKGPFTTQAGLASTTINRYNMDGIITNFGVQFNF